jgi:hypothetical protein
MIVNYWITTHWPPLEDESSAGAAVWIPEGRQQAAKDLKSGDLIVIYETKSGRTEVSTSLDGSTEEKRRKPGREGMIGYGRVESYIFASSDPSQ